MEIPPLDLGICSDYQANQYGVLLHALIKFNQVGNVAFVKLLGKIVAEEKEPSPFMDEANELFQEYIDVVTQIEKMKSDYTNMTLPRDVYYETFFHVIEKLIPTTSRMEVLFDKYNVEVNGNTLTPSLKLIVGLACQD